VVLRGGLAADHLVLTHNTSNSHLKKKKEKKK
jgi:hypothetical protein